MQGECTKLYSLNSTIFLPISTRSRRIEEDLFGEERKKPSRNHYWLGLCIQTMLRRSVRARRPH
eukprot:1692412-Amphidinium_carterae.1